MEPWPTGATGLGGVPSQSHAMSTRPMKAGSVPSTVFLCKDSACVSAASTSYCRDCDGAQPPGSPTMSSFSRRYSPYSTTLFGRQTSATLWTECFADCQPCPEGCEDRTEHCTPDCIQVTVPCFDACVPPSDCAPETCPENFGPHSAWAAPDWHAHCGMPPPQFTMNNDLQFNQDLQQLFDCCPNNYYPQNERCVPLPVTDASGEATTVNLTNPTARDVGLATLFGAYHPPSPATQTLSTAPTPELSPASFFPSAGSASVPSTSASSFACRWSDCGQCFTSLAELVGHVNLEHLRLPQTAPSHDHAHGAPACHVAPPGAPSQLSQSDALACPWSDCSIIPAPVDASGADFNASLCALASHLFYDHLNLPAQAAPANLFALPSPMSASLPAVANVPAVADIPAVPGLASPPSPQVSPTSTSTPSTSNSSSNPAPSPPTHSHKGKEKTPPSTDPTPTTHTCGWIGCTETFPTSAALTDHLSTVHVGRGKACYDCHWTDCTRNGPKHGFSSKQKVLRHLQSHTGHRPFRCDVCGLDFSEAATLQQHMRRHTQEKPYVCDFPGCGKAFAITGALTIHKRTHNGDKPFKCKYCDRAFSESSNLSKHLRTHTGQRPYACSEPGCGKRFSRPDQVTRHMSVHRKKDRLSDGGKDKEDEDMEVDTD